MLNSYTNRDINTKKQLPYHEPMTEDLIFNLPLPCSQAARVAQNEEYWRVAVAGLVYGATLRTVLSRLSKENVKAEFENSAGFGNPTNSEAV